MVKFISEISSNHSCDIDRIRKFIEVSAKIGCYAVKFQLFKIDQLFSREVLEKSKMHRSRKKWELPIEFIPEIKKICLENNIKFGCTPFYLGAVEYLDKYVDFFKISSYEILWKNLLEACSKTNKKVIISTGMANLKEIKQAVEIMNLNKSKFELLHCISSYPTPPNEANLSAISVLQKKFNCNVGLSDHSVNSEILKRAIYKWNAKIIEFHLDLDGKGEEYESGHCWLPKKIKSLISEVNNSEIYDGVFKKIPMKSEANDRNWRADPSDGLRPIKKFRKKYNG